MVAQTCTWRMAANIFCNVGGDTKNVQENQSGGIKIPSKISICLPPLPQYELMIRPLSRLSLTIPHYIV